MDIDGRKELDGDWRLGQTSASDSLLNGAQPEVTQALQWWHQRQALQRRNEADRIRDGLLQSSFCLRRSVELAELQTSRYSDQWHQKWLDQLEAFHEALAVLSDRLASPYLGHSLPLAIQDGLKTWQAQVPDLPLTWDLPPAWEQESVLQSQTLLATLDEFLRLTTANPAGLQAIHIRLVQQSTEGLLAIQMFYQGADSPQASTNAAAALTQSQVQSQAQLTQDLTYLSHSFRSLTAGHCSSQQTESQTTWYFRWRNRSCDQPF